jgi:hypothetical protein
MQTEGHPLGNPWYQEAKADRPGSLTKFRRWLWEKYKDLGSAQRQCVHDLADQVIAGEDIYLACVCVPLDCHCRLVKGLLEKIAVPARRYL